jgi:hypothetical protein
MIQKLKLIYKFIYMSEEQLKMVLFGSAGFLGAQLIVWLFIMLIWYLQGRL